MSSVALPSFGSSVCFECTLQTAALTCSGPEVYKPTVLCLHICLFASAVQDAHIRCSALYTCVMLCAVMFSRSRLVSSHFSAVEYVVTFHASWRSCTEGRCLEVYKAGIHVDRHRPAQTCEGDHDFRQSQLLVLSSPASTTSYLNQRWTHPWGDRHGMEEPTRALGNSVLVRGVGCLCLDLVEQHNTTNQMVLQLDSL